MGRGMPVVVLDAVDLEAAPGFEPGNKGFADPRLTTWLCRHPYAPYVLASPPCGTSVAARRPATAFATVFPGSSRGTTAIRLASANTAASWRRAYCIVVVIEACPSSC